MVVYTDHLLKQVSPLENGPSGAKIVYFCMPLISENSSSLLESG